MCVQLKSGNVPVLYSLLHGEIETLKPALLQDQFRKLLHNLALHALETTKFA